MKHRIWAALLLPLAFSLSAFPAQAASIPIQRKAVIAHKSTASAPAGRSAASRADHGKSVRTASDLGPEVEVGLLTAGEVNITGLADFKAESAGKVVGKYGNGTRLSITRSGNTILLNGKKAGDKVYLTSGNTAPAFAVKGNRYRGNIKIIPSAWGSGVTVVNAVPMELYLQSVVPSEAVSSWKMDALKAQAVAARTYASYHKNGYRSSGYDVTDDTRSQVYSGVSSETEAASRAVRETAGEIVTYGGKPIDAVFHSSGGGYTENSENVWGSNIPYLRGVKEYYVGNPWTKTVPLSSFVRTMAGYGYNVGQLKGIKLSRLHIGEAHRAQDRGISGRVKTIVLIGKSTTKTISGDKLASIYNLDSTLFDLTVKGTNLVITGYGYGHGLGLSQWGAEAMAEKQGNGKDYYKTILTHYYTGTKVEKMY
ncbi:SpoIID/LytB domain-containing protein [Dialister sp.]|uniref:SpoIID/LytB domain-containing protein n=1 Tax=Dialister sp. TaxID=1955814 RepID=UPI003F036D2B